MKKLIIPILLALCLSCAQNTQSPPEVRQFDENDVIALGEQIVRDRMNPENWRQHRPGYADTFELYVINDTVDYYFSDDFWIYSTEWKLEPGSESSYYWIYTYILPKDDRDRFYLITNLENPHIAEQQLRRYSSNDLIQVKELLESGEAFLTNSRFKNIPYDLVAAYYPQFEPEFKVDTVVY